MKADEAAFEAYTEALCRCAAEWSEKIGKRTVDTVYFGGGTPGLLGADRLNRVLTAIRRAFSVSDDAEITVEVNPMAAQQSLFADIRAGGFNRLSMGLQSADEAELRFLGRRHTVVQVAQAVEDARRAGFENISLDLMLGLRGQTEATLRRSVAFCAQLQVKHVSAYLLKIEPGTPFALQNVGEDLPDDDAQADLYQIACDALRSHGYAQYEISNFSRPGYESRHNLHYWRDEEYVALGASAHGFLNGKRFYYPRDLDAFLRGEAPCPDGPGGNEEEYVLLALRLTEGLQEKAYRARFGHGIPEPLRKKATSLEKTSLLTVAPTYIALTESGFLVSNAVISTLIDALNF